MKMTTSVIFFHYVSFTYKQYSLPGHVNLVLYKDIPNAYNTLKLG